MQSTRRWRTRRRNRVDRQAYLLQKAGFVNGAAVLGRKKGGMSLLRQSLPGVLLETVTTIELSASFLPEGH